LLKSTLRSSTKKLMEKGIASNMAKSIPKGFRILSNAQLIKKSNNRDFFYFLENYLEKNYH